MLGLRHSSPQYIVQVHDADRPAGVGHDQGGDLRRIENFQRFAGKQVARNGFWIFRHHVVDQRRHQIGAHVAAQVTVGDDADDRSARIDDADAAETLRRHLDQRVGHPGTHWLQRHRVSGMHQVAGIFQHGAELAARMQHAEIHRGKAAAFQQRDRQRVAQRQHHQRGGGGGEIVRAGLAGLRQRQRDVRRLRQGGLAFRRYRDQRDAETFA